MGSAEEVVEAAGVGQHEGVEAGFPPVGGLAFHQAPGGLSGAAGGTAFFVPFRGPFVFHVHDRQPDQLDGRVIGREMRLFNTKRGESRRDTIFSLT